MKQWFGKSALLAGTGVMLLSVVLAGCGDSGKQAESPSATPVASNSSSNSPTASAQTDADGPLQKYEPAIQIQSVKNVVDSFKTKEGETWESNVWSDTYRELLGIDMKYEWVTPGSQYEQKLNLSLASGKLPDIVGVSAKQLAQLIETGQIEDLTDVFEQYATEQTKALMQADGGLGMSSAMSKNRLMAIPHMLGNQTQADMLWVRMDWLQKLNLPEPQTMDDVMTIIEAFATKDPDGNNKHDTYGMGLNFPGAGFVSPNGFFNAFHAYISTWKDDGSGKLVYGAVQPEVKPALAKLREMYEKGWIDKEFAVKEAAKLAEDITSGKVGLFFGANWAPYYPLIEGVKVNPDMDWKAFPVPSVDDQRAKLQVLFPVGHYYVVKKGFEHPEAIVKMLNLFVEKTNGAAADYDKFGIDKTDGREVREFSLVQAYSSNDVQDYLDIKEAVATNDGSKLKGYVAQRYDLIQNFLETGNIENWAYAKQMAPEGSAFQVLNEYVLNDQFQQPGFYGAPTKGMVEKQAALDKLQNETFIKIIMGASDIDAFDTFVTNWNKIGGEEITQEVNAWKQNR